MTAPIAFKVFAQIWSTKRRYVGGLPRLHQDICDWLETTDGSDDRVLQAYRHSGKSYLVELYVAWRLYCDPNWTCIIVSAEADLARKRSASIKRIIENHPLTRHLVNDDDKWQAGGFTVRRDLHGMEDSVTVRSIGSSITGLHADMVIGDDIETSKNAQSDKGRELIRQAVEEMTSVADRHLYVGTPHSDETIYDHLMFEQRYLYYSRPVYDPDGTPAWHPEEWIERKRRSRTEGTFKSQYLLVPARNYETLIDPRQLVPYEEELSIDPVRTDPLRPQQPLYWIDGRRVRSLTAYWDVASGLKGKDNSVVAVAALTDDNEVYVVDIVKLPEIDLSQRNRFEPQLLVVIEAMRRNLCNSIHVEASLTNNLASDLKALASSKNIRLSVRETTRTRSQNKLSFIADTLEPLIKSNRLHVLPWMLDKQRCEFVSELERFPNGRRDDHLDAVAGAIHELSPRRVGFGPTAERMNRNPMGQARSVVVNRYQPL